jgi:hypothetical protein
VFYLVHGWHGRQRGRNARRVGPARRAARRRRPVKPCGTPRAREPAARRERWPLRYRASSQVPPCLYTLHLDAARAPRAPRRARAGLRVRNNGHEHFPGIVDAHGARASCDAAARAPHVVGTCAQHGLERSSTPRARPAGPRTACVCVCSLTR